MTVCRVQTFIVHLLRTERIPFIQSCAAWPLLLSSFGTMAAGIAICYVPGLNRHAPRYVLATPYYHNAHPAQDLGVGHLASARCLRMIKLM